MNDFRADLHCHSTCSDGTSTPTEIIQLASSLNMQGISITDHDTIAAYEEAVPAAKNANLPIISGVELSSVHKEEPIHILAYSFSLGSPAIAAFCQRHQERRVTRYQRILDLLASKGMPIPEGKASSSSKHSPGRPHIALAMVEQGYVENIPQAFHYFLGEGKPCYVPSASFSVEETLAVIHEAKGLAVIAHPHLIKNIGIFKDLLDLPFDGIEGYYARFPASAHDRWVKIGLHKGWLITGGSDFHGCIKPNIPLGCSWANGETFSQLYDLFLRNQE